MKIGIVALGGMALGLVVGGVGEGMRLKGGIVEAMTDSIAAVEAEHGESPDGTDEHDAEVGSPDSHGTPPSGVEASHDAAEGASDEEATPDAEIVAQAVAELTDLNGSSQEGAAAGARKLSRIFGAMDPDDAASVLQLLRDEEIGLIMSPMTDRVAAPILQAFDPERAAALSRIVLAARSPES